MSRPIDITRILELIPHRYPFLLVDRVLDYEDFSFLTAEKNVSMNEPYFSGHFPGNPVMPGVLILEALAQSCAILSNLSRTAPEGSEYIHFFAGIDNAKFKQVVRPGDKLRLEVSFLARKKDFWRMHGKAFVDETLVCSADLLSASKEIKK